MGFGVKQLPPLGYKLPPNRKAAAFWLLEEIFRYIIQMSALASNCFESMARLTGEDIHSAKLKYKSHIQCQRVDYATDLAMQMSGNKCEENCLLGQGCGGLMAAPTTIPR